MIKLKQALLLLILYLPVTAYATTMQIDLSDVGHEKDYYTSVITPDNNIFTSDVSHMYLQDFKSSMYFEDTNHNGIIDNGDTTVMEVDNLFVTNLYLLPSYTDTEYYGLTWLMQVDLSYHGTVNDGAIILNDNSSISIDFYSLVNNTYYNGSTYRDYYTGYIQNGQVNSTFYINHDPFHMFNIKGEGDLYFNVTSFIYKGYTSCNYWRCRHSWGWVPLVPTTVPVNETEINVPEPSPLYLYVVVLCSFLAVRSYYHGVGKKKYNSQKP